jgi:predicted NBD/HSP70 family sugar kinase
MSTPVHRQHHPAAPVVVGIDVGGTKTNATVVDERGEILVDRMVEVPSCVTSGPDAAVTAIEQAMAAAVDVAGVTRHQVRAVGLDTPGPATADGVISVRGATNFAAEAWWGFDIRAAVEDRLALPVIYNNDGNAAALYAHEQHYGPMAAQRSSISAIVGTGLGGGVIESGRVVKGATGMAGELGHVFVPLEGILAPDQPVPTCNCGFRGDLESVASLAGITRNLLPYWLTRYPDHPLHDLPVADAAKAVRSYGVRGDELALTIFRQQAAAIGRMFTIAANFTDPDAYFLGGGVTEAAPHFRDWFLAEVRAGTTLRAEQQSLVEFAIVADLDMAGARGSAFAALHAIRP